MEQTITMKADHRHILSERIITNATKNSENDKSGSKQTVKEKCYGKIQI